MTIGVGVWQRGVDAPMIKIVASRREAGVDGVALSTGAR